MKNAVIYCRVSSADQVDGTSLQQQEAECRSFCERNGYQIREIFIDKGESAKSADRPQFLRMASFCAHNKIDHAVVWKLDRFARNSYDFAVFQALLSKSGVEILSVTEQVSDSPSGRLLKTMLSGIAQFDNDIRAERAVGAMKATALAGGWVHKAPLGYKLARQGSLPVLVPDPDVAPAIYELFGRIATGLLPVREARYWLEAKLARRIIAQYIHKILRNPVYVGIIRHTLTDNRPIQAAFKGIITVDTWDRVQDALRKCARVRSFRPSDRFPLRGVVRCSECNRLLTASISKGNGGEYDYYHCRCGKVRVQGQVLSDAVNVFLTDFSKDGLEMLDVLKIAVMDVWHHEQAQAAAEADRAKKRLERVDSQIERLLDLYLTGDCPANLYQTKMADLEVKQGMIRTQINDSRLDSIDADAVMRLTEALFKDLPTLYCRTTLQGRKRLSEAIFGGELTVDPKGKVSNQHKDGITSILQRNNAKINRWRAQSDSIPTDIKTFFKSIWSIRDLIQAA